MSVIFDSKYLHLYDQLLDCLTIVVNKRRKILNAVVFC